MSKVALMELVGTIARMKTEEEYGEDGMASEDAIATVNDLILKARALQVETPRTPCSQRAFDIARKSLTTDELEIDDNAETSEGEDGTWVQAWVWVENEENEDD